MKRGRSTDASVRLADVLEEFDERLGDRSEPEILTLTEKQGFVAQRERFSKRLAVSDTADYRLIHLHDLAFNPYLLWAGAIAQNTSWEDAIISPVYPTFRVRRGYDPRFISYILHSPGIRSLYGKISYGSIPRRRRASVPDFLDLSIPKPPALPEQRRMASALDKAAAIRRKRQQAIALTEDLLRSTFLEMFGDPTTNPLGWELKQIKNLAAVTTGNTPPRARSELYGGTLEWIKSDNINTPSHYLTRAEETLSDLGRQRARVVGPGATLLTCIAGSADCIGNAAMTDREVAFNQQINALEPKEAVDPQFLYVQVLVGKRLIQAASTNAMKGLVSKGRLEAVELMSPPEDRQREFGQWFRKWDEFAQRTRSALRLQDDLLGSLSQRAFQGEL